MYSQSTCRQKKMLNLGHEPIGLKQGETTWPCAIKKCSVFRCMFPVAYNNDHHPDLARCTVAVMSKQSTASELECADELFSL